jgi:hypothetical protein
MFGFTRDVSRAKHVSIIEINVMRIQILKDVYYGISFAAESLGKQQ